MVSSVDRLFGSRTRVTLLSKLAMNPNRTFYIRELSRDLRVPYGMVYKEVKNLAELGIIEEEERGKITLVSVNRKLPYFSELRGLLTKTVGLGDSMRNALSGLKGIHYAVIYGSFATGEVSESSDVDLLIIGDEKEEKVLDATRRVEEKVGREINYIVWSEKEFANRVKAKHHLLTDIVRRPVIMIIGEEDEFRRAVKK